LGVGHQEQPEMSQKKKKFIAVIGGRQCIILVVDTPVVIPILIRIAKQTGNNVLPGFTQ